jgi:hypothetical protein
MRTHVFIVDDNTFPVHLKYLFAGTGAKDRDMHIGLLSDIKRVRPNDLVIFYIEATEKIKGGFYGIFRIAEQNPIVFHTPNKSGFEPNLQKKLIYRTLIEPYEVYSNGVPEWEVLDKLPIYATELQWSLIYRKLKAKRGCTPLLPWESEKLINMIRNKNSGKILANSEFLGGFDFDKTNRKITTMESKNIYPYPRNFDFKVLDSIYNLQKSRRAYEVNLQLYFTENIGFNNNLNFIVGENVVWFGNEVYCGVAMKKIDILTICQDIEKKEYRLIELKDEPIKADIIEQIEYYINWASQDSGRHLESAFNWNIQPVIVAPQHKPKNWKSIVDAFKNFNNKQVSLPILYFEFKIESENSIIFNKINY